MDSLGCGRWAMGAGRWAKGRRGGGRRVLNVWTAWLSRIARARQRHVVRKRMRGRLNAGGQWHMRERREILKRGVAPPTRFVLLNCEEAVYCGEARRVDRAPDALPLALH